jgi:hypothetical protein
MVRQPRYSNSHLQLVQESANPSLPAGPDIGGTLVNVATPLAEYGFQVQNKEYDLWAMNETTKARTALMDAVFNIEDALNADPEMYGGSYYEASKERINEAIGGILEGMDGRIKNELSPKLREIGSNLLNNHFRAVAEKRAHAVYQRDLDKSLTSMFDLAYKTNEITSLQQYRQMGRDSIEEYGRLGEIDPDVIQQTQMKFEAKLLESWVNGRLNDKTINLDALEAVLKDPRMEVSGEVQAWATDEIGIERNKRRMEEDRFANAEERRQYGEQFDLIYTGKYDGMDPQKLYQKLTDMGMESTVAGSLADMYGTRWEKQQQQLMFETELQRKVAGGIPLDQKEADTLYARTLQDAWQKSGQDPQQFQEQDPVGMITKTVAAANRLPTEVKYIFDAAVQGTENADAIRMAVQTWRALKNADDGGRPYVLEHDLDAQTYAAMQTLDKLTTIYGDNTDAIIKARLTAEKNAGDVRHLEALETLFKTPEFQDRIAGQILDHFDLDAGTLISSEVVSYVTDLTQELMTVGNDEDIALETAIKTAAQEYLPTEWGGNDDLLRKPIEYALRKWGVDAKAMGIARDAFAEYITEDLKANGLMQVEDENGGTIFKTMEEMLNEYASLEENIAGYGSKYWNRDFYLRNMLRVVPTAETIDQEYPDYRLEFWWDGKYRRVHMLDNGEFNDMLLPSKELEEALGEGINQRIRGLSEARRNVYGSSVGMGGF